MVVALVLGVVSVTLYYGNDPNLRTQAALVLTLSSVIVGGLRWSGCMIWRRARSASPIVRNQSTMIIIGLVSDAGAGVVLVRRADSQPPDGGGPVPFEQVIVPILLPAQRDLTPPCSTGWSIPTA